MISNVFQRFMKFLFYLCDELTLQPLLTSSVQATDRVTEHRTSGAISRNALILSERGRIDRLTLCTDESDGNCQGFLRAELASVGLLNW